MKMLSPILKVVALLAAAFCIYAWFDVKGRISTAESDMSEISGATLVEKAPNAAKIHKENNQRKVKIAAFEKRVKALEGDVSSLNSELEAERAKNVSAAAEIVKANRQIRTLNTKVEQSASVISERDSTIESLKKEILASKELLSKQDNTDELKDKINALERKLADTEKELVAAQKKAKLAEAAEVVEVVETDAAGNKIRKKIVRVPYVPTGDIAKVIALDPNSGVIAINKGKANGLDAKQMLVLKKDGVVIAQAEVQEVAQDFAALLLNKNADIPEYITLGAEFELASPVIAEAKAEEAPAKEEE